MPITRQQEDLLRATPLEKLIAKITELNLSLEEVFKWAAEKGNLVIVSKLFEVANPAQKQTMLVAGGFEAFREACSSGNFAIAFKLLEAADPLRKEQLIVAGGSGILALRLAARQGRLDVILKLFEAAPAQKQEMIAALGFHAFKEACDKGHFAIALELLAEVDPARRAAMLEAQYHDSPNTSFVNAYLAPLTPDSLFQLNVEAVDAIPENKRFLSLLKSSHIRACCMHSLLNKEDCEVMSKKEKEAYAGMSPEDKIALATRSFMSQEEKEDYAGMSPEDKIVWATRSFKEMSPEDKITYAKNAFDKMPRETQIALINQTRSDVAENCNAFRKILELDRLPAIDYANEPNPSINKLITVVSKEFLERLFTDGRLVVGLDFSKKTRDEQQSLLSDFSKKPIAEKLFLLHEKNPQILDAIHASLNLVHDYIRGNSEGLKEISWASIALNRPQNETALRHTPQDEIALTTSPATVLNPGTIKTAMTEIGSFLLPVEVKFSETQREKNPLLSNLDNGIFKQAVNAALSGHDLTPTKVVTRHLKSGAAVGQGAGVAMAAGGGGASVC